MAAGHVDPFGAHGRWLHQTEISEVVAAIEAAANAGCGLVVDLAGEPGGGLSTAALVAANRLRESLSEFEVVAGVVDDKGSFQAIDLRRVRGEDVANRAWVALLSGARRRRALRN